MPRVGKRRLRAEQSRRPGIARAGRLEVALRRGLHHFQTLVHGNLRQLLTYAARPLDDELVDSRCRTQAKADGRIVAREKTGLRAQEPHLAILARDKGDLRRLWVDLLGLEVKGSFRSERENVDEDIASAGVGEFAVEVDLMEPIDPERRPKVHEPALNHVGLWIDDLQAAVTWLEGQGVRFTPGGVRKGAAGHDVCFIHPKGNEAAPIGGAGVLIELVQAPEAVIAAFRGHVGG